MKNDEILKQQLVARIDELHKWIIENSCTHPDFEDKVRECNALCIKLAIKNNNLILTNIIDY